MNDRELRTIKSLAEAWSAEDLLTWAGQEFTPDIAMASGLMSLRALRHADPATLLR